MQDWNKLIFSDNCTFEEKARQVFEYQFENNPVYKRYCQALENTSSCHPELVSGSLDEIDLEAIPLLPIKAFKDAVVTAQPNDEPDLVFKSSGTSDMQRSVHRVHDADLYKQSLLNGFRHFYDLDRSVIWGYTPGYADNPHSSLIHMIQELIEQDDSGFSRFLPLGEPLDKQQLTEVAQSGKQLIIFGAAFGFLDLLEMREVKLPSNSIIIETGGMKTHRREISRRELHRRLAEGFGLDSSRIHSEYGMAELLSQAYATGSSWFRTVPWMQVSIRNPENPAEVLPPYEEGLIGIIDLANIHSCPFLLTGDKGMMNNNGRFQVLGRWNPKDLRGCNFLIEED
ncbi:hypothetical protein [Fodinibius salsisoli]|uniref:Acyl-protein synthetase LuxE domain-containing protein n=1 Tax=Fodinibius salsisoli TaxID=2820877 RepID=A0ABT3PLN1_9BACT|nr:hypothetical protein [Fodinibius salsisoli]MCW9706817.1 hypothetical protein [Fodinibius salsisoli]